MGQSFPTSVPSYPDTGGNESLGTLGGGLGLSRILDDYGLDIAAISTKIGTSSSTPISGRVLRGTGTGTSAWAQVVMSTDMATFSSSDLSGRLTDETGSGAAVFATSPTIVTPTIASFTNAQHNHQNAAGGGQLQTGAYADDSVTTDKLNPTVSTDANGWKVYDMGSFRLFTKRVTISFQTIGSHARTGGTSTTAPAGYNFSDVTVSAVYQGDFGGHMFTSLQGSGSSTTVYVGNTYTGSLDSGGYVDLTAIVAT